MNDEGIYPYVDFGSDKKLYLMLGPGHGYVISNISGEPISKEQFEAIDDVVISPTLSGKCFDCEKLLGDGICPDCHNERLVESRCEYCKHRI